MPLDFPQAPSVGQKYPTSGAPQWQWDGAKWIPAGSAAVLRIDTGAGLQGGPITNTGTISMANTAVSPGSYSYASLTVNALGQLTAASNGAAPLPLAGGTMLGPITLQANAASALQPVSLQQMNAVVPAKSSTLPVMDGAAAIGVLTTFAVADHRHPTDTSRAPLDSPQFTTGVTLTGTVDTYLSMSRPAARFAGIALQTGGLNRWGIIETNEAESGSNAGSNFAIQRYSDAGAFLGTAFTLTRSSGAATFYGSPVLISVAAGLDSLLTLSGAAGYNKLIYFATGLAPRWAIYSSTVAESGSNAGSDFGINAYADNGAYLSNPLRITRSNGSITTAGDLLVGNNFFVTGTLYINPTSGWEWYLTREASSGDHIYMHRPSWYDRWVSANGTRYWYGGVILMTLDSVGNWSCNGGVYAPGSINAGAGFALSQASAGGAWIADANWVYLRMAGQWGWQWDRNTGRMHYVGGSGNSLFQICEAGYGINFPALGGAYGNWCAFGWDGNIIYYAANGAGAGIIVRSGVDGGYYSTYKQGVVGAANAVYAWYSGSTAVGWACNVVSERRLKSNLGPPGDALAAINAMTVYECDMTLPGQQPMHREYAVISDEIEAIIPSSVLEKPKDENLLQLVDILTLTCALIRAVQQLTARVAALEAPTVH